MPEEIDIGRKANEHGRLRRGVPERLMIRAFQAGRRQGRLLTGIPDVSSGATQPPRDKLRQAPMTRKGGYKVAGGRYPASEAACRLRFGKWLHGSSERMREGK